MSVPRPFNRVLIANRGEVVVRIAEACRRRGLETVAIFSDADSQSPHRLAADQAFHLTGDEPATTYLAVDRILAIARTANADAIHPGYGFLAESADFARAVSAAGIAFIGPDASTIAMMADKQAARALVESLGLPVIPGENPAEQSDDYLLQAAARVGFPLLIKAVAGGGGMGMRVVTEPAEMINALAAVRREAIAAFADDRVLLERFVDNVHHVEVQILADRSGGVAHAFDRECSVQRRRQKVIEEAPSPNLSDGLRQRLCDAAVKIASAVNYCGLGTVEFIVQPATDAFYFLEMNTRLQVEHAVTEKVTGLDLVDWQLRLAEGEVLGSAFDHLVLKGWAIEARLYAEDPLQGYLPAAGQLGRWCPRLAPEGQLMSSIVEGMEISTRFDPMLAKFLAYGASRTEACRRLRWSLGGSVILGVATNRDLLRGVLADPQFLAGLATTGYLEARPDLAVAVAPDDWCNALPALVFWRWQQDQARLHALGKTAVTYRFEMPGVGQSITVTARQTAGGALSVEVAERQISVSLLASTGDASLSLLMGDRVQHWHFSSDDGLHHFCAEQGDVLTARELLGDAVGRTDRDQGHYVAPMPGRVIAVHVGEGSVLAEGDCLCILESMKMEHVIRSQHSARVEAVAIAVGDTVSKGQLLISLEHATA